MAGAVASFATVAILFNALFMQSGPHPAPMFADKPAAAAVPVTARKADAMRLRSDIVAEIQRELGKRGFYDGLNDGYYGPKTDAAIRDFERSAGLRPSAEPNDVLLVAIKRTLVRPQPTVAPRNDPIATLLAPNPRIVAVQRALTDFGYGPVTPTGVEDAGTRTAIERFEKARRRPVTGQISEQLVRELAALTGRPLE